GQERETPGDAGAHPAGARAAGRHADGAQAPGRGAEGVRALAAARAGSLPRLVRRRARGRDGGRCARGAALLRASVAGGGQGRAARGAEARADLSEPVTTWPPRERGPFPSGGGEPLEIVVGAEDVAGEVVAGVLELRGGNAELPAAGTAHVRQVDRHHQRVVIGVHLYLAKKLAFHRKRGAARFAEVGLCLHLYGVLGAERFQQLLAARNVGTEDRHPHRLHRAHPVAQVDALAAFAAFHTARTALGPGVRSRYGEAADVQHIVGLAGLRLHLVHFAGELSQILRRCAHFRFEPVDRLGSRPDRIAALLLDAGLLAQRLERAR